MKYWWKDKNKAWNQIAQSFWPDGYRPGEVETNGTDARDAWMMFERIAFLYELAAREEWKKKPNWFLGVPFDQLNHPQLVYLKDYIDWHSKTPVKPLGGVIISRGIPSEAHPEGGINLGKLFSGIYLTPNRNSKAVTHKFLISEVEKYMESHGLTFPKPKEGKQHKPLKWEQLELIDNLHAQKGKIEDYERSRKRAILSRYRSELANLHRA